MFSLTLYLKVRKCHLFICSYLLLSCRGPKGSVGDCRQRPWRQTDLHHPILAPKPPPPSTTLFSITTYPCCPEVLGGLQPEFWRLLQTWYISSSLCLQPDWFLFLQVILLRIQAFCQAGVGSKLERELEEDLWQNQVLRMRTSDRTLCTFTFHFHALEEEMATHSSVLAWRIPWTEEPGGLPSVGSHRVWHDWSNLAAAAAAALK